MGLQIVLMYAYQSLFGYVFERIGLMAATFMAGLVLGGFAGAWIASRRRHETVLILSVLGLLLLTCLITPLVLRLLVHWDPWHIELVIFSIVLVSGTVTGSAFPLIASRHLILSGNAGVTSGWTDAADHFGAAAGAAMTGILLVPLLGIEKACLVLAIILAMPVLLMSAEALFSIVEPTLSNLRPRSRPSFPYIRLSWLLIFSSGNES